MQEIDNEYKEMVERAEVEFKEEVENMLHNKFPRFLKDFLNEFVKTKFFQKVYKDRKEYADCYEYKVEDYYLVDYEAPLLTPYFRYTDDKKLKSLLKFGKFGMIPHYQYDELKVIVLDFKNKEAYLEEGMATKPYASYVLKHKRKTPKYMQPLIDKLWSDYDDYINKKGNE